VAPIASIDRTRAAEPLNGICAGAAREAVPTATGAEIVNLYRRRFTIEGSFRD
jgi:hypothetical protein